jgi:hypothetical protein
MIPRVVLPVVLSCAVGCSAPEDSTTRSGSATVTDPIPHHEVVVEPDDGAATAVELHDGPSSGMVAGSCAPSFIVLFDAVDEPPATTYMSLYFDRPPEVGTTAPLPAVEVPGVHRTLKVKQYDPYHWEEYLGGEVEVLQYDAAGWVFRFEGDGFSRCADDVCAPHPGVTVTVRPLRDGDTMPPPWDGCYAGSAFTWPDGWEACMVQTSGYSVSECPETLPW